MGIKWGMSVYTPPAAEPIHLTEVKNHLRVTSTAEDTLITVLIGAARQHWENTKGRALVTRTLDLTLDAFPDGDTIKIPMAPLRSVTSVTYIDSDGTSNTMAAADYVVDTKAEPGRLVLGYNKSWPTATLRPGGAITVRYVAGYATAFTAAVDTNILTAVGHPYSNGDIVRVRNSGGALPTGLSADTDYYVIGVSGNTLQLSTSSGGAAVDITGAGSGTNYLGEVPRTELQALMLLVAHWHENREPVSIGNTVTPLPFTLQNLLWLNRVFYAGPGR